MPDLLLERLMGYPMVREQVEARALTLHGWHHVMEEGEVHAFDVKSGQFVPASVASHSGDGPYPDHCCEPAFEPIFDPLSESLFNEIDTAYQPKQPARESTP